MSINSVIIEGNLVRECETKAVGDRTVINFSIAENTRMKDDAGQWKDGEPNYFEVEWWPTEPAYWLKRLGKGVGVVVVGRLKQDRWEKDGMKHERVRIRAESIGAKWLPEIGASQGAGAAQGSTQTQGQARSMASPIADDSIPF
jgi:single-strand DNA-binding protein